MKHLNWTWVIAGMVGFSAGGPTARAAVNPPPLEPPAAAPADDASRLPRTNEAGTVPDIRRDGPPGAVPEERVGPAPGPDYFFIPGQYVPSGAGVILRPGFWARSQPGWEWAPARWVRRSDGWAYREGQWVRADLEAVAPAPPRRHVVARPSGGTGTASPFNSPEGLPPVDRENVPNTATELSPLPEAGQAPPAGSVPVQPLTPDSLAAPAPSPTPPFGPDPRMLPGYIAGPPLPLVPPITELNLPGVQIRVGPVTLPWVGPVRAPYPPVVVPPVQMRFGRPLLGVRERIRGLIDGALP